MKFDIIEVLDAINSRNNMMDKMQKALRDAK